MTFAPDTDRMRGRLGPTGVWSFRFDTLTPHDAAVAARRIEELDFTALWVPEVGRTEAMSLATHLLDATERITVANGIARLGDRSASAAAAAHRYLQRASGGRHVLGLGLGGNLSNGPRPLDAMNAYLDELLDAWARHPDHDGTHPLWCLAAYNARMSALSCERTDGVHTYLITPAHTAMVRQRVGEDPVIAAEMAAVLDPDEATGRAIGRRHIRPYLDGRSHQRKFRELGYGESDLADGGSDTLVDDLIVRGPDAIVERAAAHREAGADHVCVQILGTASLAEDVAGWEALARLPI